MVANRNPEGVLDPKLPEKPASRALKRALLIALRCVDPNAQKRPKMGHVVHMLEAEESPFKDVSIQICILNLFKFNIALSAYKVSSHIKFTEFNCTLKNFKISGYDSLH